MTAVVTPLEGAKRQVLCAFYPFDIFVATNWRGTGGVSFGRSCLLNPDGPQHAGSGR